MTSTTTKNEMNYQENSYNAIVKAPKALVKKGFSFLHCEKCIKVDELSLILLLCHRKKGKSSFFSVLHLAKRIKIFEGSKKPKTAYELGLLNLQHLRQRIL